ncbi:MAG TPA: hypothetical protein VEW69_05860 [Alphaproteobacteria bacterium]|nr:hypothetical protein [Alphaproteobacteria bacterium]
MKKLLVVVAVALAAVFVAQGRASAQTDPSQTKTIKDPTEYNVYMTAFNTQDAAEKAKRMEAFVQQYPQTIVKLEALELAMFNYQRSGNLPKAEEMATQIVAISPDHLQALLVIAYAKNARAASQTDVQKAIAMATEAQVVAEHALQVMPNAPLPEGVSKEDFAKQKAQIEPIFYGIVGFAQLQKKEFAKARDAYLKTDLTDLQNVYRLALCELEPNPIEIAGFWHLARAVSIAESQKNTAAATQIAAYGKGKYKKYHGNTDGWDAFLAAAKTQTTLPSQADLDKVITKAPSPCEIAVKAVNDAVASNGLKDLSFGDYEFVLQQRDCSPAGKDAADTIWKFIQDKQKKGEAEVKLRMNGVKVIAATAESIDAALTEDNQGSNTADLHVLLEKPLTKLPAVGATIDVVGVISDYAPNPFMFTMTKGEWPGAPKPVVHKPPVRKGVPKKK